MHPQEDKLHRMIQGPAWFGLALRVQWHRLKGGRGRNVSPACQINISVSHFTLREGRKGALLLCEQRGLSTLFFTRLNNSLAVAYALVPAAGGRSVSELMND